MKPADFVRKAREESGSALTSVQNKLEDKCEQMRQIVADAQGMQRLQAQLASEREKLVALREKLAVARAKAEAEALERQADMRKEADAKADEIEMRLEQAEVQEKQRQLQPFLSAWLGDGASEATPADLESFMSSPSKGTPNHAIESISKALEQRTAKLLEQPELAQASTVQQRIDELRETLRRTVNDRLVQHGVHENALEGLLDPKIKVHVKRDDAKSPSNDLAQASEYYRGLKAAFLEETL